MQTTDQACGAADRTSGCDGHMPVTVTAAVAAR
jgi:hypothetical protein